MNTTTQENVQATNDNILIDLNGNYNQEVHKKLNRIINNIALKYSKTNMIDAEDLKQDAWCKIYEAIKKSKLKGEVLNIKYLVIVAKMEILAKCIKHSNRKDIVDDFSSMLLSSNEKSDNDSFNVSKSKLEYNISKYQIDKSNEVILRLALEEILESIEDYRVKNLIIIRYIKNFNGLSPKINKMYVDFYNSIEDNKREILDNMNDNNFTLNDAFKVLGMRATDNSSTRVRNKIKQVLYSLYIK